MSEDWRVNLEYKKHHWSVTGIWPAAEHFLFSLSRPVQKRVGCYKAVDDE